MMMKKILYFFVFILFFSSAVKGQITIPDPILYYYIGNGTLQEKTTILDSIINDNLLEPGMNAVNILTKCEANINTFTNPADPSFPFKSGIVLSTAFPDEKLQPGGDPYYQVASGVCRDYDDLLLTIAPEIEDVQNFWVNDTIFLYTDTITKWQWYNPNTAQTETKLAINGVKTTHDVNDLLFVGASLQGITLLEFDFTPQGNNISFDYLFASEEYNNPITTQLNNLYNDAFGFFLYGTNPKTGVKEWRNLALIPGTNTPIRTRNINDSINSQYYDTGNPLTAFANFTGLTKPLTAYADVVPCENYTIQLAIGNYGGNSSLVSAVFIEGKSFKTGGGNFEITELLNANGDTTSCVEGCKNLEVNFKVPRRIVDRDTTINIKLKGNAINGTDYKSINQQVFVPAGQLMGKIVVEPLTDAIPNELDSIVIVIPTACEEDSITLYIQEPLPLSMTAGDINTPDLDKLSISCGDTAALYAYALTDADVQYEWYDSDNQLISSDSSVKVSPKTATMYKVKVSGACSEKWDSVLVELPPVPVTITPIAATVCPNTNVDLSASSIIAIDTWEWYNYANLTNIIGSSSRLDNYPIGNPTKFRVKAYTTDGCYGQKDTVINVFAPIDVDIQMNVPNATIYPGDTAVISVTDLTNENWTGMDFYTSSSLDSIFAYPSIPQSYMYHVTGNDMNGCITKDSITLNVIALPTPNIKISMDTVCENMVVIINDSLAPNIVGINYNWNFDGGVVQETDQNNPGNFHVFWNNEGTKTIELKYQYKGQESTSNQINVFVLPVPRADFTLLNNRGCVPLSTGFTNTSTGVTDQTTYYWEFGDGKGTSHEQNPTYVYEHSKRGSSGKLSAYDVKLVVSNKFCADTNILKQIVVAYPVPNTEIQANKYVTDEIESRIYFTSLIYGDIDSLENNFVWNFGDGSNDTIGLYFSHKYTHSDTFQVVMIAKNEYQCVDTNNASIVINQYYTLYVPNSFSPGGNNPYWKIYGNHIDDMSMKVFIYNRWGNLIYTSPVNSAWQGWDGTMNGKEVPSDVYHYKIVYYDYEGRMQEKVGAIYK